MSNSEEGQAQEFWVCCMRTTLAALVFLLSTPTQAFQPLTDEEYTQQLSAPKAGVSPAWYAHGAQNSGSFSAPRSCPQFGLAY